MKYVVKTPILGIDTISALPDIPEGYAVKLTNYFPSVSSVNLRKGFQPKFQLTNSAAAPITSVYPIEENDTALGICGGNIWDLALDQMISDGIVVYNQEAVWARYKAHIYMTDGINPLQDYDVGAKTMAPADLTGGVATGVYRFVGTANQQLLFIPAAAMGFYFLPVGNISGALSYFDLSQIAKKGGALVAAYSFGRDAADGYHQYIAFITSEGEIIVYSTTDFGDADKTEIVGVFNCGRPLGQKPGLRWGGDLVFITDTGIVPISQIVANGELIKKSDLFSNKIQGALATATDNAANDHRWGGVICSGENMAVINTSSSGQLVMNTNTGAWCVFNLPAYDFAVLGGKLYFGTENGVFAEYFGTDDDGEPINGEIQLPYSKYGSPDKKSLQLMQTRLKSVIDPNVTFSVGVDFVPARSTFSSVAVESGAEWADEDSPADEGVFWDEADWGQGALQDWNRIYSVSGFGTDISLGINTSTKGTGIEIFDFIATFEPTKGIA